MRCLVAALAMTAVLFSAPARAQDEPPIVTDNPGAYAQALADAMTLSGMRPMREAYEAMYRVDVTTGALPPNIESALITYERAIGSTHARVSRVVEDVTLSDSLRVIYLYHYYGSNYWFFTRIDFHAMGEGRWALATLAFADQWSGVFIGATPSFRPSASARR